MKQGETGFRATLQPKALFLSVPLVYFCIAFPEIPRLAGHMLGFPQEEAQETFQLSGLPLHWFNQGDQ